jgi:hypothetical protein
MTDRELDKRAAHHLAVICHAQEVTGNVSRTCRYCGITRQAYYKWRRRCEAGRDHRFARRLVESLHEPAGDQRRCGRQGRLPAPDLPLRAHTHKIAMFLKRYYDLELRPSGIWRILKRLDMSRLPASQR